MISVDLVGRVSSHNHQVFRLESVRKRPPLNLLSQIANHANEGIDTTPLGWLEYAYTQNVAKLWCETRSVTHQ